MAASPPGRSRRPLLLAALAVVVLAVIGWEGWQAYLRRQSADQLFGSGSIEATQVDIASKITGRIVKLAAAEGDTVHAGEVLVRLDGRDLAAQVDQARANVAAAEAKVTQAASAIESQQQTADTQVAQARAALAAAQTRVPQAQTTVTLQGQTVEQAVAQAQAQLSAAQAQAASARSNLAKAQSDYARAKMLLAQGAIAAQDVDAARTAYDAAVAADRGARDAVTQARAGLASAQANRLQVPIQQQNVRANQAAVSQAAAAVANAEAGYTVVAQRRQDLAAAQAALAQARAALRYQQILLGYTTVVSPIDGVVLTQNNQEGEVVAAGGAVYTIVNPGDMWLRVYIPEDQIARVHLDQRVQIAVDTYPGRTFPARVSQISTKAEFTPINVQSRENRVKLVYGVKLQITSRYGELKPGMPADATIYVGSAGPGQPPSP
ncbi:MAG TPA: HlyD family efflux transporter periplasmic adaptor subunit [bacterium]|nr:HlyD family efflux transporter periplasmic adaptor subunit [bacterium]